MVGAEGALKEVEAEARRSDQCIGISWIELFSMNREKLSCFLPKAVLQGSHAIAITVDHFGSVFREPSPT